MYITGTASLLKKITIRASLRHRRENFFVLMQPWNWIRNYGKLQHAAAKWQRTIFDCLLLDISQGQARAGMASKPCAFIEKYFEERAFYL